MNYDNIKQKCNFKHKILFSGEIYVCGGFDGYNRHTSMECYNPKTDQVPTARDHKFKVTVTLDCNYRSDINTDGYPCTQ
jgi:hypothetical protein